MTSNIDGLASGLDTTTIIQQLMAIERRPQVRLQTKRSTENEKISIYQTLNSRLAAIGTAADALSRATGWATAKATTSDDKVATVTTTSGALPGQLSFTVQSLASAHSVRSNTTVASTASIIHQGPSMLVSAASGLGFFSLATGTGLELGRYEIEVTQASAGAAVSGTAKVQNGITLTGAVTLEVEVDGVAQIVNLDAGTYADAEAFAAHVEEASGGTLTAKAASDGTLRLATVAEGSAHTLRLTGGTNLAELGLVAGGDTAVGTDAKVKVGDTETVLTDVREGVAADIATDTGTISAVLGRGLRVGETTAVNVSVGDGSLAAVVSAINGAKAGVTATAVQVGPGAYRLQLTSTTTGSAAGLTLNLDELTGFDGFTTLTEGTDAVLTVGTGPGAYQIRSASNTVTGVMPGVTINLLKVSEDPVTVTVNRDPEELAEKVNKLVTAINDAFAYAKQHMTYDAENQKAGLLLGDGLVTRLLSQLRDGVSRMVSGTTIASPGLIGLTLNADGTVKFDRSKFLEAYNNDPEGVAAMFQQGGFSSAGSVISLSSAGDLTREGTWTVEVTQAARQASTTGAQILSGIVADDETIELRVNGRTATYTARAGETLEAVAAGITAAAAEQDLGLVATVENNRLVIRTVAYGSSATFELRSSGTGLGLVSTADTWEGPQEAGLDVAGTINGVAATGKGQFLQAPADDPVLNGVVLRITASGPISGETFTYAPGLAQRLDSIVKSATDTVSGSLTLAIQGRRNRVTSLDKEISLWDSRLAMREAALKRQFANLELALQRTRSQGNWLAGQIASLGLL